jgi:predicted metal-dependent phosphotriesterase family hydrolase
MAHIQTVLGPVDPSEVGFTLPAEHFYTQSWEWAGHSSYMLEDDDVLVEEIGAFQAQGGSCIVDDTPACIGRRPERLAGLSRRTGLHIVMGTGWYTGDFVPPEDRMERRSVAELADSLIAEIEGGVGETGIKPGCVGEFGPDRSFISPLEERFHRAIARATNRTGIPLITHAWHSPVGLDQMDLFDEEGVDPGRVAIGHLQSHPILEYWVEVCRRGAYALIDNVGIQMGRFEERIVGLMGELLDRGYERQILLAHDLGQDDELRYYGGRGYMYLAESFIPLMRAAGIPDSTITMITVDNPRRLLTMPDGGA